MENMISELEEMEELGIEMLKIYYAEDIVEGSEKWSVDVMQDELNNLCDMGWTWTVMSFKEFKCILNDGDELSYVCDSAEIIVDKLFSDDVIRKAINMWLDCNDINIKVEMIDIKDAGESGYVKKLKERMNSLT